MLLAPRYRIETLSVSAAEMVKCISHRRRTESWQFAIVEKQLGVFDRGMILLRREDRRIFSGLYFSAANCGEEHESVKRTAEALHAAGWTMDPDGIFEFLCTHSEIQITELHTPTPVPQVVQ